MLEIVTSSHHEVETEKSQGEMRGVKRGHEEVETPRGEVVWRVRGRGSPSYTHLPTSWRRDLPVKLVQVITVDLFIEHRVECLPTPACIAGWSPCVAGAISCVANENVQEWKVGLHSCVDSSPLYLRRGEEELVAIGSHSGQVVLVSLHTGGELWRTHLTDR